jgi:hypothetical protein
VVGYVSKDAIYLTVEALEDRMRPGQLSQGGFLGKSEKLLEVMARDDRALLELGVTHEELAARLDGLLRTAMPASPLSAHVENFEIKTEMFTGFQICPWAPDIHSGQCTAGGGVDYGSVNWKIRNLRTGQEMHGPGLAVHLIRDHHFFEGLNSPCRVDPLELARLLGFI